MKAGCPECNEPGGSFVGDGKCNRCEGSGVENVFDVASSMSSGNNCIRCGGSGACPRCDGTGWSNINAYSGDAEPKDRDDDSVDYDSEDSSCDSSYSSGPYSSYGSENGSWAPVVFSMLGLAVIMSVIAILSEFAPISRQSRQGTARTVIEGNSTFHIDYEKKEASLSVERVVCSGTDGHSGLLKLVLYSSLRNLYYYGDPTEIPLKEFALEETLDPGESYENLSWDWELDQSKLKRGSLYCFSIRLLECVHGEYCAVSLPATSTFVYKVPLKHHWYNSIVTEIRESYSAEPWFTGTVVVTAGLVSILLFYGLCRLIANKLFSKK